MRNQDWRRNYLYDEAGKSLSIALIGAGDLHTYDRCIQEGKGELWDAYWLKEHHHDYCVYDIDPVRIAALQSYGIQCKSCDICKSPLEKKYDRVLLIDVIEHVTAPADAFAFLAASLTDTGRLVVSTPNLHYWMWFLRGDRQRFPEDHLQAFSVRLLKNLGNRAGLQSVTSWNFQSYARNRAPSLREAVFAPFHILAGYLGKSNTVLVEFRLRNE